MADAQVTELRTAAEWIIGHGGRVKAEPYMLDTLVIKATAVARWVLVLLENNPTKEDKPPLPAKGPGAALKQPPANLFTAEPEQPKMPAGAIRPHGHKEPEPPAKITPGQADEIRALCKSKNITEKTLNGWVRQRFRQDDIGAITLIEADAIIEGLRKYQ